jgi:predicted dehydrogenase
MRVLIVGCGNIAGAFDAGRPRDALPLTHAGAYTRDGRFTLAACVDPDAGRREAFMARWGVPVGVATIRDVTGPFDVVSICSPTAMHAADIEAALALAPRAIFCEKPLTPSLAASTAWVDACAARGVALAVNHTRRWAPDVQTLVRRLHAGEFGEIRSAAGWYGKGVLNNGSHLLDLLLWMLGPLDIAWTGAPVHDFWPDDPTIPAVLTTRSWTPVHLCTAHAQDYALFELQLVTQAGLVTMEAGGLQWRHRSARPNPDFPGYRTLSADSAEPGLYGQAMLAAAGNIHDHITSGAPLACDGGTALAAQRLCETIRNDAARPHSQP